MKKLLYISSISLMAFSSWASDASKTDNQIHQPTSEEINCGPESYYFDEGRRVATIDCGVKLEFAVIDVNGKAAILGIRAVNQTSKAIELNPSLIQFAVNSYPATALEINEAIAFANRGSIFKRIIAGLASGVEAYGAGYAGQEERRGSFNAIGSDGTYVHGAYREQGQNSESRQKALDTATDRAGAMQDKIGEEVHARTNSVESTYMRRTTLFAGKEYISALMVLGSKKIISGDSISMQVFVLNKPIILTTDVP